MPDPADLARQLADLLGPRGWISGEDAAPWQRDWLDRHGAPPLGVARPGSTAEVAAVVRACRA
ncbi:MAG TPA: FAD-binding oxidoreductase, partial [Paracoccus solventivorans]|nr:FAD-binding oxidoreductase [Paracoccus solventivorans]